MTERDRIILGFSDQELLRWWESFGYCPHRRLEARMAQLLDVAMSGECLWSTLCPRQEAETDPLESQARLLGRVA